MCMEKVSLPKGTRDFGPTQMAKRQFIIDSIKKVFQKYGFQPLETPAMENLSTLTGKYGEEGDQLLFKILNSGDFLKDVDKQNLENRNSKLVTWDISEKGLRYDLTVPFARYVVMNRHEITFPFKRYQIQPVWRADRPQRGRYREFYQCDADVVGTSSLICEAEIILMIKGAFRSLGISDYSIKINHRGILSGLAEIIGAGENESALFVAIDKLDKIGEEKVKEELRLKNFKEQNLTLLFETLNFKGNTKQKIDFLTQKFSTSEKGQKGIKDFNEVLSLVEGFGDNDDHVEFDIALARGLSYYTGCIFEVKVNNVAIGSVSGGGRYDNLTAVFDSKEKSSGVGISFGIDRIYDAMEELKIFPKEASASSTVLITYLDETSFAYGLKIAQSLREKEIASEIYPDQAKIKKQMEYADKKKIPFVIVIGSEEVKTEILTIKKMETGDQSKLSLQEIINTILPNK
ncbi:MAG TPA: histidine--tRNA ligase [Cyclobacteriaceae bacterium]|nr:histidine--tRNA ligase [Cyclobacteriaceae bacterium]